MSCLKHYYKVVCLFCIMTMLTIRVFSQDIHHSQFWMNPIAINPAATGFFDGIVRVGLYNRTQWLSVTKPYQTNGIWLDLPIKKRSMRQDLFGFGTTIDYDFAGDSRYSTFQVNAFFSYARALNRKNNHFLKFGISGGVALRTINYASLHFDEQYKDGIFDPNNPVSETFSNNKYVYPDCGAGIQWYYQPQERTYYQVGFAAFHFNRPKQSLLGDKSVRLPIKYTVHSLVSFGIQGSSAIIPSIYFSVQGKYREFMIGGMYEYYFATDVKGFDNKINVGLDFRWGDAIYIIFGGEWRRIQMNISYDFNVSKLSAASHGRGGVELSMVYIFSNKKLRRRGSMPCPIF